MPSQTKIFATIIGAAFAAQAVLFVLWTRKEDEENKENANSGPVVKVPRLLMHYDMHRREYRYDGDGEVL
ncbi:unnamed protein product [Clonostachys rosea]|uniref:Uncharacterized protein n=1 Tax=Bionectria ochroleuca TaxID=29856 RepID=A0ABY6UE96_BIOOC|nr:unnamed protein product [Clonostachys rosea]